MIICLCRHYDCEGDGLLVERREGSSGSLRVQVVQDLDGYISRRLLHRLQSWLPRLYADAHPIPVSSALPRQGDVLSILSCRRFSDR